MSWRSRPPIRCGPSPFRSPLRAGSYPLTKIDLVSCRNLLIYLETELQKRPIPLFHYSLNPAAFYHLQARVPKSLPVLPPAASATARAN